MIVKTKTWAMTRPKCHECGANHYTNRAHALCWNCGEKVVIEDGSYRCTDCAVECRYTVGEPRPSFTRASTEYIDHATVHLSSPG